MTVFQDGNDFYNIETFDALCLSSKYQFDKHAECFKERPSRKNIHFES